MEIIILKQLFYNTETEDA